MVRVTDEVAEMVTTMTTKTRWLALKLRVGKFTMAQTVMKVAAASHMVQQEQGHIHQQKSAAGAATMESPQCWLTLDGGGLGTSAMCWWRSKTCMRSIRWTALTPLCPLSAQIWRKEAPKEAVERCFGGRTCLRFSVHERRK
jgi:hypothetical protein